MTQLRQPKASKLFAALGMAPLVLASPARSQQVASYGSPNPDAYSVEVNGFRADGGRVTTTTLNNIPNATLALMAAPVYSMKTFEATGRALDVTASVSRPERPQVGLAKCELPIQTPQGATVSCDMTSLQPDGTPVGRMVTDRQTFAQPVLDQLARQMGLNTPGP